MGHRNPKKYMNYKDVVYFISNYLKQIPNLSLFCEKHNLDYTSCVKIKNEYTERKLPGICKKLLGIMDYNVSYEKTFILTQKSKENGNTNS